MPGAPAEGGEVEQPRGVPRIGTSGYQYDHWRGAFYPEALPKGRWLAYYAERLDSVEVNNTFYRLPEPATFDHWREQAPAGFLYALKYSRYGSHLKRLKDPAPTLEHFLAGARRLGDRLGPVLVQLPPRWRANPERLDDFLALVPEGLRFAVEVRDPDWLCAAVYRVLERHGAALCWHDMLPDHPRRLTADWVYLRYHGDHYQGRYADAFLAAEAEVIRGHLADGRDVYAYFNNDEKAYAAANALTLRALVAQRG
jgi:uncharacterized protein YecE (DUF72 family)